MKIPASIDSLSLSAARRAFFQERGQTDRLLIVSTAILFVTAIVGSALTLFQIGSYRVSIFRLYTPIYVLLIGREIWADRIQLTELPAAIWAVLAIGAYATLSLAWMASGSRALFELFTLLTSVFIVAVIFLTTKGEQALSIYVYCIFGLVAVGELLALIEIFGGYHLPTSRLLVKTVLPKNAIIGVDAASAWAHNQNNFSFFLALAVGPLLALSLDDTHKQWVRGLCRVGVFFGFIIAIANGSRIATIAMIISSATVIVISVFSDRVQPIPHHRRNMAATIGFVFLGAFAIVALFALVPNPFVLVSERSLWRRWQLGVAGVELLVQSGGVGVGVGNIRPALRYLATVSTDSTFVLHNWLLYFLSGYGIPGGVLFLSAYGTLLYRLGIRAINTRESITTGLFGMLLAFPLNALGPSNAVLTHSFWVFLGLAAVAAYQPQRIKLARARL